MKRSPRVLVCSLLALSAALAEHGRADAQTDQPTTTPPKRTHAQRPARPVADTAETVQVHAGVASANGVTDTTPGGGLMQLQTAPKSVSAITRDYIAKQAPTSNVQQLISDLPGVITSSQDPLGITGDQISIRGFDQTQIGYLFEGAPVADPVNYEPYTNILVDSENIAGASVTQGSTDINAPIYNASGGQISVTEIDPTSKPGGYADLAGGTKSANKEFVRLDTGLLGRTGIRAFVSFSHTSDDNFRGPGGLTRYHVDGKAVKDWGDGNRVSLVFNYNSTNYNSFTNPTLAQFRQYGTGYNFDANYTPGDTNYYKLNQTNNGALMLIVPTTLHLADNLFLRSTPYLIEFRGPSLYGESIPDQGGYFGTVPAGNLNLPYAVNGAVPTEVIDPYVQRTAGLNNELEWKTRANDATVGYWYAYTQHAERETFDVVEPDGITPSQNGRYSILTQSGQVLSGYDLNFKQQSNVLYSADTVSLLDGQLKVGAGFKVAMLQRGATNLIPGADYRDYKDYLEPLPQFNISYRIDSHDQVYADATTSFRAPGSVEAYGQIFDPGASAAVEQPGALLPEYTIGEEIGYRHTGLFNVSGALFNYNLTHHQVTSEGYLPGTNQLISEPLDVGGQTKRGAQLEIGLAWWHHFSPYVSGQYLYATDDNNYNDGADYLPTAGKISVQSPRWTGAVGLNYDNGHLFANFDLRYVDKQYSTFMDDQALPSYVVADFGLGYRLPDIGPVRHPQIQLNLSNLGNNTYLSGIAGVTGNAQPTKGVFGTTVAGASPTYYVGGDFAALVSISSAF